MSVTRYDEEEEARWWWWWYVATDSKTNQQQQQDVLQPLECSDCSKPLCQFLAKRAPLCAFAYLGR